MPSFFSKNGQKTDETYLIETPKKLNKGIIESLKTVDITCLLYVEQKLLNVHLYQ